MFDDKTSVIIWYVPVQNVFIVFCFTIFENSTFIWRFCLDGFRNSFGGIAGTNTSTTLLMKMSLFEERRFSNDDNSNDWSILVTQPSSRVLYSPVIKQAACL